MTTLGIRQTLRLKPTLRLGLTPTQSVQAPAGHFFLLGKLADGSHVILRGLTAPSTYVNLSGKTS